MELGRNKEKNILWLHFYDSTKPIVIAADASDYELGATFLQEMRRKGKPVAFASCTLTTAERNYALTKKVTRSSLGLREIGLVRKSN